MTTRLNTPYTKADQKRIRSLAMQGYSAREAAKITGRSRGGLAYFAMREGISFHSIKQAKGVQKRPSQRKKLSRIMKARHA